MRLFVASGLVARDAIDGDVRADEKAMTALAATAEEWVRGGVVFSIEDWSELSTLERAAILSARSKHAIATAAIHGMGVRNPEGVAAEADGGAAKTESALDSVLSKIAESARTESAP